MSPCRYTKADEVGLAAELDPRCGYLTGYFQQRDGGRGDLDPRWEWYLA